jgi:hypothetical protein
MVSSSRMVRFPARQALRARQMPLQRLHMMYYNFVRIHQTLCVTPAMAAGVTGRLWEIEDIVALLEAEEGPAKKRGPYKKRVAA